MSRVNKYVLDSYAILCYLEGEKGAKKVTEILKEGINDKAEIFMSVINWGEIYYIILREQGAETAEIYLKTMERYPIKIIDVDKTDTLVAAQYKAFNKISYADAFAIATTISKKAKLITGDKEFKSVESEINIIWL